MSDVRHDECRNKPHYFEMFMGEAGKPCNATVAAIPDTPCTHKGETLRTVDCPTCTGHVKVKVFACSVHGECTIGKSIDGIACCLGCKSHSELT